MAKEWWLCASEWFIPFSKEKNDQGVCAMIIWVLVLIKISKRMITCKQENQDVSMNDKISQFIITNEMYQIKIAWIFTKNR